MPIHSALWQLGYTLYGAGLDSSSEFGMFAAYFDESGKEQDRHALTVAGGVSSIKKWLAFEKRWNEILRSRNVTVFHMSECAHGRGEFKGWSGTDRRDFISDLAECMLRYIKRTVAVSVVLSDWREVNSDFKLSELLKSPYVYAAWHCVGAIMRWRKRIKESAPIEYVFEDGAIEKGLLFDVLSKKSIYPLFKPKILPQLQAADLIAWKTRRVLHDMVGKPFTMTAQQYADSLKNLRAIPGDFSVVEQEKLLLACQVMRIPPRLPQWR